MAKPKEWDVSLKEWDTCIRQGQAKLVQNQLRNLTPKDVPLRFRRAVASISRRVDLTGLGIRLLNPIVRATPRTPATGTPQEKVEYAACLTRIGAIEEAEELFKSVPESQVPEVLFFRAFSLAPQWNYEQIVPLLRRFVEMEKVDEYMRFVGKLNLAAALVYEKQYDEAEGLLEEVKKDARERKHTLMLGNACEIQACMYVSRKNWNQADFHLQEAKALLEESSCTNLLFVEKWYAISDILKNGSSESNLEKLLQVRSKAVLQKHWETIRECDKYIAIATQDVGLLAKVYFATPFIKYRERLLKDFPLSVVLPNKNLFVLGDGNKEHSILDLETGSLNGKSILPVGGLLHRLMTLLSLDHYRPLRVASIHHYLYPEEYFNPDSSPNKVRQIICRFRKWAEENKAPIEINESQEWYSLTSSSAVAIQSPKLISLQSKEKRRISSLEEKIGKKEFNVEEVATILELSSQTAYRVVHAGVEDGKLMKVGKGPATKYRFTA